MHSLRDLSAMPLSRALSAGATPIGGDALPQGLQSSDIVSRLKVSLADLKFPKFAILPESLNKATGSLRLLLWTQRLKCWRDPMNVWQPNASTKVDVFELMEQKHATL